MNNAISVRFGMKSVLFKTQKPSDDGFVYFPNGITGPIQALVSFFTPHKATPSLRLTTGFGGILHWVILTQSLLNN
jgi:hypothetical protein